MRQPLLRFLQAARGAGVRISAAEAIDAFRAAEAIGYADREALKDGLGLTVAKTTEEKQAFDACFDLYFSRDGLAIAETRNAVADHDDGVSLAGMLRANDQAGLAAAMEAAGEAVGVSGISFFTQTNLYARRMLDRMGLPGLEDEIARLRASPETGDDQQADRLDQAQGALARQIRAFVEQQLELYASGRTRELREAALRNARLTQLDRRDIERMRILVRALARQIATRYGRRQRRALRGQLDVRRTLRRNMGHDTVPFRTAWKRKRIDRPRVVAICDVSGSVAGVARFLLMFLYALTDVLSDIRSFAFSSDLQEVSSILEAEEVEPAIARILHTVGFGSTNYGRSLATLAEGGFGGIDRKTTVIILGDARGNYTDPRTGLMREIFGRAQRVLWLNPEPRSFWGTGDSDMLQYLPFCHDAVVCNTLKRLERIVADLVRA